MEEINVANISAKVKRREESGLTDVSLKSLNDTQVEGLKRWLNAQDFLKDEVTESYMFLVNRVADKTGRAYGGENPNWEIWKTFGWTKELIDAAIVAGMTWRLTKRNRNCRKSNSSWNTR